MAVFHGGGVTDRRRRRRKPVPYIYRSNGPDARTGFDSACSRALLANFLSQFPAMNGTNRACHNIYNRKEAKRNEEKRGAFLFIDLKISQNDFVSRCESLSISPSAFTSEMNNNRACKLDSTQRNLSAVARRNFPSLTLTLALH